jgi:hypothetical protein
MNAMPRLSHLFTVLLSFALAATVAARNENVARPVADLERLIAAEPLVIAHAQVSRPTATTTDITLRAEVSFAGEPPMRVKLRRADPGAEVFNNVPRYDLAAYELQKMFLDPAEYVVPPTSLRFIPLEDFRKFQPSASQTFRGADQVLTVVQYWLQDVTGPADVLDMARFQADTRYARHIGQLNVLTYLIEHGDSNAGNFLIGRAESGARVFSVDHGVAFSSTSGDRGELWKDMRVKRLPADTVARLREITGPMLQQRLSVLAQWKLEGGRYVPVAPGPELQRRTGVRRSGNDLQMGLTPKEIGGVQYQLKRLLKRIDAGEIGVVASP